MDGTIEQRKSCIVYEQFKRIEGKKCSFKQQFLTLLARAAALCQSFLPGNVRMWHSVRIVDANKIMFIGGYPLLVPCITIEKNSNAC